MSIATLLWLLAVSGLVTGVAGATSAALRRLGRPERWVWIVALAVIASLPFLPAPAPVVETGGTGSAATTRILPIAQVVTVASASLPESALASIPWIPILWTLGSIGTIGVLLGGAWSLSRRREHWPRRRVDGDLLRVSDRFGPAVVGWIDPEIVVPAWALELEARQRRMILRHENEHRWARDPQLLALGVLLLAAAPWNPFAWLQFRGLRRAIEFDCDARVLDSGTSPRAYGRLLVSVQLDAGRGVLFAPALREPASFLERRLKTMKLRHLPISRLRVAGLALVAGVLTFVACETPKPTERVDDVPLEATGATSEIVEVSPTIFEAVERPVDVDPDAIFVFEISADGAVTAGALADDGEGQRIMPDQVGSVWRGRASGDEPIALVRVAPDAPYSRVQTVLDELKSAGATRLTVQEWTGEPASNGEAHTIDEPVTIREMPGGGSDSGGTLARTTTGACPDGAEPVVLTGKSGGMAIRGCPPPAPDAESTPAGTPRSILGPRLEGSPLIYVDGMRITDESALERIRPDDIERIEVIKGETAAEGVIHIFTKKNG